MSYKNMSYKNMSYKNDDVIYKNIGDKENITSDICKLDPPWAAIIMLIFGGILLIYTAMGSNINSNVKIFGIIMILLWTLLWTFLLYLLWKDNFVSSTWWMLVIGFSVLTFFFILIIILNIDNSI
jgi:hypothetical protein